MTEAPEASVEGFAVLDKPVGLTSHRFLSSVTKLVGPALKPGLTLKSGHAGTLDSFASGVLICLFGRYTRLSDYFMSARKGYDAVVQFGSETDTLDPQGREIATAPLPSLADLESVLGRFRGDVLQAPPAYSAVHVNGERAYSMASRGQDVRPPERPVTIFSLELLSYEAGKARLLVECSKGTYIRSLARDLALAAGSRGHLVELRRTFSGPFRVEAAVAPEAFSAGSLRLLGPGDAAELGLAVAQLDEAEARVFQNGLPLHRLASFRDRKGQGPVAAFRGSSLLGIAEPRGSSWRYAVVFEARA